MTARRIPIGISVFVIILGLAFLKALDPNRWVLGGLAAFLPLVFFGVPGAFRFLRPETIRGNPLRNQILRLILTSPAISVSKLAEELGVRRQTITYHLNVLRSFGLLTLVRDGNTVKVYPSETQEALRSPLALVLERRWARPIMLELAQNPETSLRGLASRLGLAPATVRWYVRKLADAGVPIQNPNASRGPLGIHPHTAIEISSLA